MLSVAAADAIRAGLGDTGARVPADALAAAAAQLILDATSLTVGQLHKRARGARDDLDEAGIADRERHQCAIQYIKAWRRGDGMVQGTFLATIDQQLCDTGSVTVTLDDNGQCVNVGRTQRLFTARQRVGLGVRDGGCLWPGCDRPPAWCEAHHINHWNGDSGETNIEDGVLLCRFHHVLLHNNGWDIHRDQAGYWLKPPRTVDRNQVLLATPSKSPIIRTRHADSIRTRLDSTRLERTARE